MEKTEIIERLKNGWELANRGKGWWLTAPRIPYRRSEQSQIEDDVVEQMEKQGLIKPELGFYAFFARLAD
jgi:DNA invertase Pin-like site-specific DNA recombinase